MATKPTDIFAEGKENIIGHVATDSGSLMIADGIVAAEVTAALGKQFTVDLSCDNARLPIVATKQAGRRFLLIPIDAAEHIPPQGELTVEMEDKAEGESSDGK